MDTEDYVFCYQEKKDSSAWRYLVDRNKVYAALLWLKRNNPNYWGISLPEDPNDFLIWADTHAEDENSSVEDMLGDGDEKPYVKRATKEDIDMYGDITLIGVHNDHQEAKDLFKVLRVDTNPITEHKNKNLDCLAFPEIYPYGKGGIHDPKREVSVTEAFFEKARVLSASGDIRRNSQLLFHNVQRREKREIQNAIFKVQNSSKEFSDITKVQIQKRLENNDDVLRRKVQSSLNSLPTRSEFWINVQLKVDAMCEEYGTACLWVTHSPGEYLDSELYEYLKKMNADLSDVDEMTPSQLIAADPVLANAYLQAKFDAILEFILSDFNPLGKVTHHFCRTEYQSRAMPHFHSFFWIDGSPIIGVNSDKEVLDFITSRISCKLPSIHDDPDLHTLVDRFQRHKCNAYCLRKGKHRIPVCKFSFPREPQKQPVLHSVLSSIISRKTRTYKRKLYELERTQTETRINDYNPVLMKLWRGNIDIQFIAEDSGTLVKYIAKYATKSPKSEIDEFYPEMMIDKSEYSKLLSLAIRMMKSREMGAMEATNFLLARQPYKTDAEWKFLNLRFPHMRKRILKTGNAFKNLSEDSKDIYNGDIISTWYPSRPDELESLSLYEFARNYQRCYATEARIMKNKQDRLIELKNNHGLMKTFLTTKAHPYKPIVYGPKFDPVTMTEQYYYSYLLLHRPWRQESELIGQCSSYEVEYEKCKSEFPAMLSAVNKDLKRRSVTAEMAKNITEARNDKKEQNQMDSENLLTGPEEFILSCKNSQIKTEEDLIEVFLSLSSDQKRVYTRITGAMEHYYKHMQKPSQCTCDNMKQLLLFVSGFAGAGKSYLIKALMGWAYVKMNEHKEPCNIILGAPTGIAARNIAGQTIHSLWGIPVEHNRMSTFKTLDRNSMHNMGVCYKDACGQIIDEISMVSSKMLLSLHCRMSNVFNERSSELNVFGGLPMVFFGDLFQLQPPGGSPIYVPLSAKSTHAYVGGVPVAFDVWKHFEFEELTSNHRQDGSDNTKYRETLDRFRIGMLTSADIRLLNTRLIDVDSVSGDDKDGDCRAHFQDAIITKFLECEREGLNPVCLLPKKQMVDEFNQAIMTRKNQNPRLVPAIDTIVCPKNKEKFVKDKILEMDKDERQTAGLEKCLKLDVSSRVMLRRNLDTKKGLVNGSMGTVAEIYGTVMKLVIRKNTVDKIMVKFDGIEELQSMERVSSKIKVVDGAFLYRTQFPIVVSYSMTIHKSQSLSLPCVFADIGDGIFCEGQSYVAVSRCTSLQGLYLINFNPLKARAPQKACEEYARLKNTAFLFNCGHTNGEKERVWYTDCITRTAQSTASTIIIEEKKRRASHKLQRPSKHHLLSKLGTKTPKNVLCDAAYKLNESSHSSNQTVHGITNILQSTKLQNVPNNNGGYMHQHINYYPVDEAWQQRVCLALGLPFVRPSSSCSRLQTIIRTQYPNTVQKIRGDGNCFYRALSYVITGSQDYFVRLREIILDFVDINTDFVEEDVLPNANALRRSAHTRPFADAGEFVAEHRLSGEWATSPIMAFTAILLKTEIVTFTHRQQQGNWVPSHWFNFLLIDKLWLFRRGHLKMPSDEIAALPETSNQQIFLNHDRSNHFEVAHDGVVDIHSIGVEHRY